MKLKFILVQALIGIVIFLLGLFAGYKYSNYKQKEFNEIMTNAKSMNYTPDSEDELKYKVIVNGDKTAYKYLRLNYCNSRFPGDFLFYDLIMANKYSSDLAHYFVYSSLKSTYKKNGVIIDDRTKKMALDYLYKGVNLNSSNCDYELSDLYKEGKWVEMDTVKSNFYLKKAIKDRGY